MSSDISKKKKGSFLARKAQLEKEKSNNVQPDDVLMFTAPTEGYLCTPEANTYGIEFTRFKLRDMDSGVTLFEVAKPSSDESSAEESVDANPNKGRFVKYEFGPSFLKLRTVGATVDFVVGDKDIPNFRMIERHYFQKKLLKSFDFQFGFVIPRSRNSVEQIYEFPALKDDEVKMMMAHPYETKSDSFYFVGNQLVMHNKAEYSYCGSS
ncbi:protein unc-119 homolog B-like [Watersipora subatra]|uniref:protein unc-119 homolog B-like n=1 Tax=Watersipora subatra TaxID=2589382 RepID=UPI00355BEC10